MVVTPTTSPDSFGPMVMSPTDSNHLEVVEGQIGEDDHPEPIPEPGPMDSSSVETHDDTGGQIHDVPTPMPTPAVPVPDGEHPPVALVLNGTPVTIPYNVMKGDVLQLRQFLARALPGRSVTAKLPESVAALRRNIIRQEQYITAKKSLPAMGAGKSSRRRTPGQTALLRAIKTLLRRLEAELASEPGVEDDGAETDEVDVR